MSAATQFHGLTVARVDAEAGGAIAVTFAIPADLREVFAFTPGQFLTLRATIDGQDIRRSYSICSSLQQWRAEGTVQVGIRPVEDGVFSNWAVQQLHVGDSLQAMAPQGRFCVQRPRALHRVGFAAGSGITPILSIMTSTLQDQPKSKFTLVYGNRRMDSVMFNEALQDLKDTYPDRLTLIHVLSRQAQEVPLLEGRIDGEKVNTIMQTLLPVKSMDEVFICGPEGMIEPTEKALLDAGARKERVYAERFLSQATGELKAPRNLGQQAGASAKKVKAQSSIALTVQLDGKSYEMGIESDDLVLDAALNHGLDLPYSCKGGVCCTCRAKVMEGQVDMAKNFTLSEEEIAQGFVLSCQARAKTPRVVISFDER
jgi:ring-1,2-phenylacetyl-CoA epoxidase subunit PaaE